MADLNEKISEVARNHGFALTGFATLRSLPRESFYTQWLAEGRMGEMAYLARNLERRYEPRRTDPMLRSVISLAYPYQRSRAPLIDWRRELRGRIAAYALGPDYHDWLLAKARSVAHALELLRPGTITRVYVDTGPVFEREWASEAGIGWFGKNTNLLNRSGGSYFFLAEIFTDADFGGPERNYGDFCGTCRRCLDLCPTRALAEGYLLEPRLCISYLTIELRGSIPAELRPKIQNWIFGCDICQEVCPWNPDEPVEHLPELTPSLTDLLALDDEQFRARFRKTAVSRTKRRGLLRNVAVALGNSGNPEAIEPLGRALVHESEAVVRSHAAWALGRLGGPVARRLLERHRAFEPVPAVIAEIDMALTELR